MKKVLFIFMLFVLYSQKLKSQINQPLYLLFDPNVSSSYCELKKMVDNNFIGNIPPYDLYCFETGMYDTPYSGIDAIYGGDRLILRALDKTQYTTITGAQLSNYNVKTYDELVVMFAPLPLEETEEYFHNREVYIIERVRGINPTYHILRVTPFAIRI